MAMAEHFLARRFNRPGHTLFDHRTWVIASDGDIMEGVAAEAMSIAGRLRLGKLIVFWDDNDITIDGRTSLSLGEDVLARVAACGWHTESVADGEDVEALVRAAEAAKDDPRPSFIRVKTIIGYPAPNKRDTSGAHGAPLGKDEILATKKLMGWPEAPFHVPAELAAATEAIRMKGQQARAAWEGALEAYRAAFPAEAAELEASLEGRLPEGWSQGLPEFPADPKGVATRKASHKVLNALAARLPNLVGGSADLACSNLTYMDGLPDFLPEVEGVPRNVAFGIREHGMAAAVNGMALHGGVIPFGATFLIFSDYMRPALRLAALMKVKTRYVFTHDSIGLGEDGPTHQPVEQLAVLRAIPGFTVLRPADANETRVCWELAIEADGPAALVLTRQNLPTLDREKLAKAEGARRGAYVLSEAEGGAPQVLLLASGSEVSLALEAQAKLAADGVRARVVSVPSFELFEAQDAAYRRSVLPPEVTARVGVEAGIRQGWDRYVGAEGGFVGMRGFGASAPAEVLFEKFGITADAVVAEAKRVL
jgi:transketolase